MLNRVCPAVARTANKVAYLITFRLQSMLSVCIVYYLDLETYVVGPKSFRLDIKKPHQMGNAVTDI